MRTESLNRDQALMSELGYKPKPKKYSFGGTLPEIQKTHRVSNSRKAERRRFIDKTFKMPSELQEIEKINNRVANMLGKNKERTKKIENVE